MLSATDELARYYTKLFTLGTLKENIVRFSFTYVLQGIYFVVLSILFKNMILYLLLLLLFPILYIVVEKIFTETNERDSKLFSFRRLLALNTITNIIIIVETVIFTPLFFIEGNILATISFIIGSILAFKLVVYYSISKQDMVNLTGILFIPVIIFLIIGLYANSFQDIAGIAEPLIYGVIISTIFLYAIYIKSRNIVPQGVYEYLKGYIDSWVLDDPLYLDDLISKYSIDIQLKSDLILFPDTYNKPSVLIMPYFHFGPFKNTGSSRFPSFAGEYYYIEKNMNATVFHTPVTHDLDLSKNNEMENVLEQLSRLDNPLIFTTISDIHEVSLEKARAYAVKLEHSILVILEAAEMEDIPYDVAEELKRYGRELSYKRVIVIDAHNSLQKEYYKLPNDVVKEILLAGKKVIRESLDFKVTQFKISLIKTDVPSITPKKGLGSNGISIILWETFSGFNSIICIDSNNMSPLLREALKKYIRGKYNSRVVITSTDTHEVTALQLNMRGYSLLGEDKNDINVILDAVDKAFDKAIKTLKESDGLLYEKNIKASVLGVNTFDRLRDLLNTSYSMMKKLIYYFIIPAMILQIIGIYLL